MTWVSLNAGILVWDSQRTGKIISGRQLFGSVSWWVFFDNCYQAFDTLDDNRDGKLTGAELDGISVWFDRNGNDMADSGKIVLVYQLGVAALPCRATGMDRAPPANFTGMRMTYGRELPAFEWIASAVEPPEGTASVRPLRCSDLAQHRR